MQATTVLEKTTQSVLTDGFGREHTDMRISLTDKCNFRCVYCMREDQRFTLTKLELDTPELLRVARVAHRLGIRTIRLTGGEPLMRKDAVEVVRQLSTIGFEDISMTTNGSLLTRKVDGVTAAQALREAGLNRVNISCDSLQPDKFARIRRRGDFDVVMAGIAEAHRVGFSPIKMNTVVIRGQNDDEVLDFANYVRETWQAGTPVSVRFIEFMPLGETGEKQENWTKEKVVSSADIVKQIDAQWPLTISSSQKDHAPASRWAFKDGKGEIGVIPTMTNPFCSNCNRLRVTGDGFVMRCLFSRKDGKFALRNLMRRDGGCTDDEIADVFLAAVASKRAGQDREKPDIFENPGKYVGGSQAVHQVSMSQIGG
jgi:cyclic pyranopterin phosphate synthase